MEKSGIKVYCKKSRIKLHSLFINHDSVIQKRHLYHYRHWIRKLPSAAIIIIIKMDVPKGMNVIWIMLIVIIAWNLVTKPKIV